MKKVTKTLPCQKENRSFFEKLQNADGLDLRDRRGKRHDLAVVLLGVTLAVLSNRDGNLSSIHRHLRNHYEKPVAVLGVQCQQAVSRSQLPLILEKVSIAAFDQLLFENYGIKLKAKERQWFACDGKELRGSISEGEKRGEAIIQAIAHDSGRAAAAIYYSGEKESEQPALRQLLNKSGLAAEKLSFDALHCKAETLEIITRAKGKYLVGLKDNQKLLKRQITREIEQQSCLFRSGELEKGHGRLETRRYEFYDLLEIEKEARWNLCQIKTLVTVNRERVQLKSGKSSREISYYLTNEVGNYEELCQAVRNHWQVETSNLIRDVSFKEDQMRSKKRICTGQWRESEHWRVLSCRKQTARTKKRNWKISAMILTI